MSLTETKNKNKEKLIPDLSSQKPTFHQSFSFSESGNSRLSVTQAESFDFSFPLLLNIKSGKHAVTIKRWQLLTTFLAITLAQL